MADERTAMRIVLSRLSDMRQSMSKDEQVILDRIVMREDDEVVAHSIASSAAGGVTMRITLNVATGEYEQLGK